jgi:riboflavin kinase, archaea type
MKVKGRVVKGLGESGKFLAIDWVDRQLSEKLGFSPFPGTLNIRVGDASIQEMLKQKSTERLTHQSEGFCDAVLFKVLVGDKYECGVVIPLVPGYDGQLLEIVAPVYLKQALGINDGDEIVLDLRL